MIRKIFTILNRSEKRHLMIHMLLDVVVSIADIGFLALLLALLNRHSVDRRLMSGFLLLFIVKNLFGYYVFRAQCKYLMEVANRVSRERLLNYLEGSYSDYVNIDTSVHIRAISYHPREFAQHILGGVQQVFTQTLLVVLAIAGIAWYNLRLSVLLVVVLLPPVFAVFYFIRKKLHAVRAVAKSSSEKYLQHLHEALTGYVEGNIYNRQEIMAERFLKEQGKFNGSVSDQLIILGMPGRLIEVFAIFGLVLIIGLGNGDQAMMLTIGVFMAAAYKIIPGIVKIMNSVGQMNTYAYTLDKLAEERTVRGEPAEANDPIREIQCRQLVFSYRGRRVLNRQDLAISAGEFVGICGPSGQGKSTILNLLLGFLSPEAGDIYINGAYTDERARRAYWGRISYVKQQPFLLHDTILHNITLGGYPGDGGRLLDAAKTAGLLPLINSFPEKWDKVIAENGKNISGGQRQRIAFARALYKDADLLILDEPFSELDEHSERKMMDICQELTRKGKTVLLITHNRENLLYCDKTIVLDEV